jgi:5-methylcytosine-specific restriction endonuclease McrA
MAFTKKNYVMRCCKAIASKNKYYNEIKGKNAEDMALIVLSKEGIRVNEDISPKSLIAQAAKLFENGVFKEKPTPVTFYESEGWIYARKEILGLYGRTCMKCNKYSDFAHVDHIKPRSKYPDLELDVMNLQVLCKTCNKEKSNLHETDYRTKLPRLEWAKLVTMAAKKKNEGYYKDASSVMKSKISSSLKKLAKGSKKAVK